MQTRKEITIAIITDITLDRVDGDNKTVSYTCWETPITIHFHYNKSPSQLLNDLKGIANLENEQMQNWSFFTQTRIVEKVLLCAGDVMKFYNEEDVEYYRDLCNVETEQFWQIACVRKIYLRKKP